MTPAEMDAFLMDTLFEEREIDAGLERAAQEIADEPACEVRREREE